MAKAITSINCSRARRVSFSASCARSTAACRSRSSACRFSFSSFCAASALFSMNATVRSNAEAAPLEYLVAQAAVGRHV